MWTLRNSSLQIVEGSPEIAVFGIGAIEQHGNHLPLATDWLAVEELGRLVAEALDAYLVPSLPFSMSQCHGPAPGTVWLKPETLAMVVRDIVSSLQAQGINKIVLVNGHGGNFVLEPLVQELNLKYPSLRLHLFQLFLPQALTSILESGEVEVHGGEMETSIQLFLHSEEVRGRGSDCVPQVGREFLDYVTMDKICTEGIWGKPSLASPRKGEMILSVLAKIIIKRAKELFRGFAAEDNG